MMSAAAPCIAAPACDGRPARRLARRCGAAARSALAGARVDIQQDATGFTIMQEVRVSDDVRADYDNAHALLRAEAVRAEASRRSSKVTQSCAERDGRAHRPRHRLRRTGDLDSAEASLKRALEINPRHPIAYNELGMVQRRKGQFAAARTSYEKALALSPAFHYARRNLAILCDLYLADSSCALTNYEAYLRSAPDDQDA